MARKRTIKGKERREQTAAAETEAQERDRAARRARREVAQAHQNEQARAQALRDAERAETEKRKLRGVDVIAEETRGKIAEARDAHFGRQHAEGEGANGETAAEQKQLDGLYENKAMGGSAPRTETPPLTGTDPEGSVPPEAPTPETPPAEE